MFEWLLFAWACWAAYRVKRRAREDV